MHFSRKGFAKQLVEAFARVDNAEISGHIEIDDSGPDLLGSGHMDGKIGR